MCSGCVTAGVLLSVEWLCQTGGGTAGYLFLREKALRFPRENDHHGNLSSQLYTELKARREVRELEAMANGQTLRLDKPVFLSQIGFRWDEHNLAKLWEKTLKASGVRKIRIHDLRHTFASQLIEQGAHVKYIQEQLGHASMVMTMDTYGHLFSNRNRGLVDGLDTVESDQSEPETPSIAPHDIGTHLVRPEGLEPPTPRSVVWCSIH